MMLQTLTFEPAHMEQIVNTVRAQPDVEVCGLLGGMFNWRLTRARAQTVYVVPNIAHTPQTRFVLEPASQIATLMTMLNAGQELVGIFHSHPHGPPHPSATDLAESAYPDVAYCILFPASVDASSQTANVWTHGDWQLGAWQIKAGQARPIALMVD
jgi:desampylase